MSEHAVEIVIFVVLFVLVSGLGFVAARWRRAESMAHLDEWGLGGRSFGSWVTWFLVGGDLYTAYTFVAVPALMFGAKGSVPASGNIAPKLVVEIYEAFRRGEVEKAKAAQLRLNPLRMALNLCTAPGAVKALAVTP